MKFAKFMFIPLCLAVIFIQTQNTYALENGSSLTNGSFSSQHHEFNFALNLNNRTEKDIYNLYSINPPVFSPFSESIHSSQDTSNCIETVDSSTGDYCGSRDSVYIKIRNGCTQSIDAFFWLQKSDLSWDRTGAYNYMGSGVTTSTYICHGTGRYKYWARPAGSNARPPDAE